MRLERENMTINVKKKLLETVKRSIETCKAARSKAKTTVYRFTVNDDMNEGVKFLITMSYLRATN